DRRAQRRVRRAPDDADEPEPDAADVARRRAPRSADAVEPGVAPERLGDRHGAVGPLVVLQQRRDDAGEGEAAAVERVDEPWLAVLAEADVRAPCLEVLEVRDGRDLQPAILARAPH